MWFLLPMMQQQMNTETTSQLTQLAEALGATSGEMIGDRLENIDSLSDYGNEDYNALRGYLDAFCDASYRSGSNLYYVLYHFRITSYNVCYTKLLRRRFR